MADDGVFRTDNMALATVLALEGYTYSIRPITPKKALWHFNEPTDDPERSERFDDLISDFDEWTSTVEPRAFILRYSEMRHELMQMLRSRSDTPRAATG